MPFAGGLSPPTERTRNNMPWMGGAPQDKERRTFDQNAGGDHKFIEPDPDGLSHAVGTVFDGEWDDPDTSVPYNAETVVVDEDGKEHVFKDRSYEMVLLEWQGRYKYIYRRVRHAVSENGIKTAQASGDIVPLAANVIPACFKIESDSAKYGKREVGSCFAVARNTFLTCAHAISKRREDPEFVETFLVEDDKRFRAVPLDVDYDLDLAVVSCDLVRHTMLESKSIVGTSPGAEVICVGSPYGYDNNLSRGIVSSMGRNLEDGISYFFVDLSVYPGSSGGPIVDVADGRALGIAAIIVQSVGNYGLNAAIPMDYAAKRFPAYFK